ncbi:MAG: haloacid dehalogenase-like hydrolase, partial [Thermodesulfobacteriota bacterium]
MPTSFEPTRKALSELSGWSSEARAAIGNALSSYRDACGTRKPVAAFDCDMTTVHGETGWTVYNSMVDTMSFPFGDALYAHIGAEYGANTIAAYVDQLLPLPQSERLSHPLFPHYRRLMLGANYDRYQREGGASSCPWVVKSYAGLTRSFMEMATRSAIDKALQSPRVLETVPGAPCGLPDLVLHHGIQPFAAVANLMSLLKAAGFDIVMVSGSHQLALEAMVELAKLQVDRSFGMDPVIKDGVITTELKKPLTWHSGKPQIVHQYYPYGYSMAFGDSPGDTDLLNGARDAAIFIQH